MAIQIRRDTAANWASNNPIPEDGQPCYATDSHVLKIGDGVLTYNSLPTISVGDIGSVAWDDVTGKPSEFPPEDHGHEVSDVAGLQTALDGKSPTDHNHTGVYAPVSHGHAIADVSGLQTALDGKSATGHGHAIADVSGLQTVLDGKSAISHNHDGVYSPVAHNHDAAYSAIGHDHAGVYSPAAHNHAGVYEPANANIQTHVTSPHAPADAQKNSDITKAEIEAKLTGVISSHSHSGGGGGITNSAGANVIPKSDGTNIVASGFSNATPSTLSTSQTEAVIEQTGDTYGATSLRMQNRTGAAGAIFQNSGLNLVDFIFAGNVATMQMRMEARGGSPYGSGNSQEFQFIDSGTSSFFFVTGLNTTAVRIGNFGVGTTNPTARLHVAPLTAAEIALKLTLAASPTGNAVEVNSNAGSGGDLFKVEADGDVVIPTGKTYKAGADSMASEAMAAAYAIALG